MPDPNISAAEAEQQRIEGSRIAAIQERMMQEHDARLEADREVDKLIEEASAARRLEEQQGE